MEEQKRNMFNCFKEKDCTAKINCLDRVQIFEGDKMVSCFSFNNEYEWTPSEYLEAIETSQDGNRVVYIEKDGKQSQNSDRKVVWERFTMEMEECAESLSCSE